MNLSLPLTMSQSAAVPSRAGLLRLFRLVLGALAVLLMLPANEACARIAAIQSTKDPRYDLGYRTSDQYWGLWIRNEGYVLTLKDGSERYMPLTSEKIRALQAKEILPRTMPPYSPSWRDFVWVAVRWLSLAIILHSGVPSLWRLVRKLDFS